MLLDKVPDKSEFEKLDSVVVRFAGDSGDGIQLTGSQFTVSTALTGSDLATFPDFPAEIRAPAGTTFGVSAYQINFGSGEIMTAGDEPDVLVALNPAALKVNLPLLKEGGLVVADSGSFIDRNFKKAGLETNPLDDDTLTKYQLLEIDIQKRTVEAVKSFGLGNKDSLRCKNMWALGLMLWMFGRKRKPITDWLEQKFATKTTIRDANIAALNAGHAFGETAELGAARRYRVDPATVKPGLYRTATGSQTLSWGLVAGADLAKLRLVFCSYPITPASPLLHTLSEMKEFGTITFQAEDEIAAVCAAIGASYAGSIGVTSSSGPGIALKQEALGLAISTELPLVIVNSQRAGPSTGMPTKTEQSDLYQAVYGRNADAPLPVLATRSPGDCFDVAVEAVRIATKYMVPVIVLTDGYIANAAEPFILPDVTKLEPFPAAQLDKPPAGGKPFNPFTRDPETLARAWAKPGTPGLEHRIGGIEKSSATGHISYDADNHQEMTSLRSAKVAGIAKDIPSQETDTGADGGALAVVGWGSTYGPIAQAVRRARRDGLDVSHVHIRYLKPFPENLGDLLTGFDRLLVPELNMGQLATLLRDSYALDLKQLNKVSGQPFKISEILDAIRADERFQVSR